MTLNCRKSLSPHDAAAYSPLALAFLGDSVYEQLVRQKILLEANRPAAKLHEAAVAHVCAAYQAAAVTVLLPLLTEQEEAVFKRGRNATGNTVPRHASPADYRRATGLEALFGYLQLCGDFERMEELFAYLWEHTAPERESKGKDEI